MNFSATSGLDTFAKIRTGRTIPPAGSSRSPAPAHRASGGVMSMYAEAEMIGTSLRSSRSAVRSSSAGSAGEFIRLTPHPRLPPSARLSS
jgi:hypothetical protein